MATQKAVDKEEKEEKRFWGQILASIHQDFERWQTASQQGKTEESVTICKRVPVPLKYCGAMLRSAESKFCVTLMARDWKGFGNQDMQGVMEIGEA